MKKAILVTSFGTSYLDALKLNIESTENAIKNAFPQYDIKRAFTSPRIIKKLKERDNLHIDNLDSALKKLKEENYEEVLVLPLHIIAGAEYDDILDIFNKYKNSNSKDGNFKESNSFKTLKITKPLLFEEIDYSNLIESIKEDLRLEDNNSAVILAGHGTYHKANETYTILQNTLEEKGYKNIFVATLSGKPYIEDILPVLKEREIKEVKIVPIMLVAGDHVKNDIAGEEDDSWNNILTSSGIIPTFYIHGLGEKESIHNLYIDKVNKVINSED